MTERNIYQDIATRTNGEVYLGVVGPVRTGKSTFIKRFMELLVIPNIDDEHRRVMPAPRNGLQNGARRDKMGIS